MTVRYKPKGKWARKSFIRRWMREWCRKQKAEAYRILGGICRCCEEDRSVFLTIDHVKNDGYKDRRFDPRRGTSGRTGKTPLQTYREIIKNPKTKRFQILCMNCNWAKQFGPCPHRAEE